MQTQLASMLKLMQTMRQEINELKHDSKGRSSRKSSSHKSKISLSSECDFSLSSSMREALRRGGPGESPSISQIQGDPHGGIDGQKDRRKELDEVKGIPAYPTTAEFAGWKRETRYAVAAASVHPQKALHYILKAEKWNEDVLKLPCDPQLETLEVKFGKALRSILRGDAKREVANLEERVLREQGRLLNGTEIYA